LWPFSRQALLVVWSTLPAVGCNLRSGGQALMAWAVSNARVEPKGNAIVITKQASGTAKIDPLMAAFNAIAWMAANPASSQPSIFVI
jgi:phage terminase large subunit-like protein